MEQQVTNVLNEVKEVKPLFREIEESELISNRCEGMDKVFDKFNENESASISVPIECKGINRKNNLLLSDDIKEDKIDLLKSAKEIKNTSEYEINSEKLLKKVDYSKNKFSELYKLIIDKDVIRIINGGIYIPT